MTKEETDILLAAKGDCVKKCFGDLATGLSINHADGDGGTRGRFRTCCDGCRKAYEVAAEVLGDRVSG